MYVLFDDGRSFDRRLRYEDTDPSGDYLGRYDPSSEAFRFFSPIDNVWGDYRKRDEEEDRYAYEFNSEPPYTKEKKAEQLQALGSEVIRNRIKEFNDKYYLKYGDDQGNVKGVVDITKIDPDILKKSIGVAFTIFRSDSFQDVTNDDGKNRSLVWKYFLKVQLVGIGLSDLIIIKDDSDNDIALTTITPFELMRNNDYKQYPRRVSKSTIYQLGPTLVLNSKTILNNRNYKSGQWAKKPFGWESMIAENPNNWDLVAAIKHKRKWSDISDLTEYTDEFIPRKYWGFDPEIIPNRMVIRLGREGSRYILFLHGSKEGSCPIRIPQDEA